MASDSVSVREFGERLKRARQEQSRSLDELSSHTRIHRRHLEAIESGEVSHLPEGPYAKAFIREYARALGVPVPNEFAAPVAAPKPDAKDPKVVSRPAKTGEAAEDDAVLPITAVAKETVRFANSAMTTAVKSVAKTTEKVVDFVETGSKEAIEVLTSKTLWDEADQVRRERLGLAPIEPVREAPAPVSPAVEEKKPVASVPNREIAAEALPARARTSTRPPETRVSSRGATNVIIALLVLLFAGAVFYAIRTYRGESGQVASTKDYVPAPLDKPSVPSTAKRPAAQPAPAAVPAAPTVGPHDSLSFFIKASSPVWISVAPDGIPAYRGELKTGEVRSFKAGEKFVVNIGNQKSVALTLNGHALSNLPTIPNSGVVIRDLVLTRDHAQLGGQTVDISTLPASTSIPVSEPAVRSGAQMPAPAKVTQPSTTSTHSTSSTASPKKTTSTAKSTTTTSKTSTTSSSARPKLSSDARLNLPKPKVPSSNTPTKKSTATSRKKTGTNIPISPVNPVPPSP